METITFDKRRKLIIPGSQEETIRFCVQHFIKTANDAIQDHNAFYVALSGGSTPKAIFQLLASDEFQDQINWQKVWLFWSDERAVPPTHPDSNYKMALDSGLDSLGIPHTQIFRMMAENEIEHHAHDYERLINLHIPNCQFDLIMLGMGEDGHTASLFPHTHALHSKNQLVVPNYLPKKDVWRMTLTYHCIHMAKNVTIYVLGSSKADMVKTALNGPINPDEIPIQKIGTDNNPCLWILDLSSSKLIN